MGVADMWKAGRGHLGFCSQNTVAPLQHHPRPSPPSGLQLGLSALLPSVPGGLAAPGGDFVTDTSGWGGEGQGVRHEGWGRGVCAIEKIPRMGRGGGHPSMSQLKRWCFTSMSCTPSFSGFFSFSCRTTQRRGSVHHTQKRGGRVCGRSPSTPRPLAPRQSSFLHFPPLRSWHTERPCGLESTGEREPAISICPSWAGQAAPSASTATQLLLHSLPWQGKQPHPQPLELAPEETEDGLKHKAGRGRQ